jgi:secondary thiamine-phosphate synthase enzyme
MNMKHISIQSDRKTQWIELTLQVEQAVEESGVEQGTVTVYVPHTTAGVTINERADPDVARDLELTFDKLVPWHDRNYRHAEGNSAAHMKAALVGTSTTVFIEHGHLKLGTWQGIFFCEFDGPRARQVWVKIRPD